jgi:hypothetical protein
VMHSRAVSCNYEPQTAGANTRIGMHQLSAAAAITLASRNTTLALHSHQTGFHPAMTMLPLAVHSWSAKTTSCYNTCYITCYNTHSRQTGLPPAVAQ